MTDGGRRGDSKYRSAARHRAAWCRPPYNTHGLPNMGYLGRTSGALVRYFRSLPCSPLTED